MADGGFSVLVTGANRGIGFGLVKRFLERSDVAHVFAAARNPNKADALKAISDPRLHIIALDAQNDESIEAAKNTVADIVGKKGLNLLINNAGILHNTPPDVPTRKETLETLEVNTVGPLIVSQIFLPLLKQAASHYSSREVGITKAAVVNITSDLGSISANNGSPINGDRYALAYRVSKAGLNQVTKTLAIDWKNYGILVVGIHPGWVQTDMGTDDGELTVEFSAKSIEETVSGLRTENTGGYFNWLGRPMGL